MLNFLLPTLIVPEGGQEEVMEWATKILKYTSFTSGYQWNYRDIRRYNYRYGIPNQNEFTHITKLYSLNEENGVALPAFIRVINPIDTMVNREVGRMLSQPFTFTTRVNDQESIKEKLDDHKAEVVDRTARMLRQQSGLSEIMGGELYPEDIIPEDPSEVMSLTFDKMKNEWEEVYQSLLELFQTHPDIAFNYKYKQMGAESLMITNKMFFERYFNEQTKCPDIRFIDPRNVWSIPNVNSPYVEDSPLVAEVQWLTLEEILQRDPKLSDEQVEQLKQMQTMYFANSLMGYWQQNYGNAGGGYEAWFNNYYTGSMGSRIFRIKVARVYWKANKRKRYKVNDKAGYAQQVDDKKKIDPTLGETEEIKWDEEVWQGTIYGHTVVGWAIPIVEQPVNKDAPSKKKLPIIGIIDPRPSFVDNLIDLQCMRTQLFYKLELTANQPSGNVLVIDRAAGGNVLQNLYNLGAYRIIEIDTSQEGNPQAANGIKTLDMDLSNSIIQLLQLLNYYDTQMMLMSGQNDAAAGQLKDYTSNGVAQQNLAQSQLVNLPRIDNFFTVGEHLLQSMCELVPLVWRGKRITKYYLSAENQQRLVDLELPKNEHDYPNMAVSVTYSASDVLLKERILGMANNMLATTTDPTIMNALMKMNLAPTAKMAQKLFSEAVEYVNSERAKQQQIEQQNMAAQQQAMLQARLAPAQIQAEAHKEGKQITANAELQKQAMKSKTDGMLQDAKKKDDVDLMVAQSALGEQSSPEM